MFNNLEITGRGVEKVDVDELIGDNLEVKIGDKKGVEKIKSSVEIEDEDSDAVKEDL